MLLNDALDRVKRFKLRLPRGFFGVYRKRIQAGHEAGWMIFYGKTRARINNLIGEGYTVYLLERGKYHWYFVGIDAPITRKNVNPHRDIDGIRAGLLADLGGVRLGKWHSKENE